jgi:UDP-N-acetylmuramate--alanine ligase
MLTQQNSVHFVGIGGAGMSAIAKVLLEMGYKVSGSDLKPSSTTQKLADMGATTYIGHRRENLHAPDLLIVSTAIPDTNVEVVAARDAGIPILQRGEMLAHLMEMKRGIAVAGSHGKTTTTSMIALLLERTGMEPTVLIGGELNDIGGNAKLGNGEYLVAEADESDGSFLKLKPEIAIVTNIEDDHLDYYGAVEKIVASFRNFLTNVQSGGVSIVCIDSNNVKEIINNYTGNVLTYSVKGTADLMAKDIKLSGLGSESRIVYHNQELGVLPLNVPGVHNIANALAAVAVGLHCGLSFHAIAQALVAFRGVHRRFELVGEVAGVKVFDDYGHHPTEIKATLKAARQGGFKRIIAIFQPHRYTRTKFLFNEFAQAFEDADEVIITDIYAAGEQPIPGVNAALIINQMQQVKQNVHYVPELRSIPSYLTPRLKEGDLVLTIGAGDVWQAGVGLIDMLQQQAG